MTEKASSPTHSSDFEFSKSTALNATTFINRHFCPADELFFKGQLLPLHLSPRINMLRSLHFTSSDTTTSSRDSSGSSSDAHFDYSRPSSVTEDDEFKQLNPNLQYPSSNLVSKSKKSKCFSLSILSSIYEKGHVSSTRSSGIDVIRKYIKKLRPIYSKIGEFTVISTESSVFAVPIKTEEYEQKQKEKSFLLQNRSKGRNLSGFSSSSSENLRYPKRKSCVLSRPPVIRSSPAHPVVVSGYNEELQSKIEDAIAHCKNSMSVRNENFVYSTSDITYEDFRFL